MLSFNNNQYALSVFFSSGKRITIAGKEDERNEVGSDKTWRDS